MCEKKRDYDHDSAHLSKNTFAEKNKKKIFLKPFFCETKMRNSDYGNVRKNFVKLYGNEEWMKERENRWNKKTEREKEIDRKLFYALAQPEKFQNDLYTEYGNYDRKKFQHHSKNLSDAKNLLKNGATNDFIFKTSGQVWLLVLLDSSRYFCRKRI